MWSWHVVITLWYSEWILLSGVWSGNMDMYETRNKFAFVDIMCANCLYIKHKFQRYVFPITTAPPRKPTYFFCFSFASNYKNRVWRNEVMMKKQVRKHVTNARNELIHFRIKITAVHCEETRHQCSQQSKAVQVHSLPYQNSTLTTYEHKAYEIKSGASRFRTREGGQRDPDGQQRHAQKWVKTSNYLRQICPKSF